MNCVLFAKKFAVEKKDILKVLEKPWNFVSPEKWEP